MHSFGAGRRAVTMLIAASLAVQPTIARADTLTDLRTMIAQAQSSVQQIAARRQGQQTVVQQLRGVSGGRAAELQKVDAELIMAVNRYRQAEADLEKVEAEATRLEGEIAAKEKAVQERAGVYGTRLRALYKFTRTSPLEQLLAARSFTDALHRITMMQAVTRVDNRLLGQLRGEQEQLHEAQEALAVKRAEAAQLRDELDAQRKALEAQRATQALLVAQAQSDQRAAESALTQLDQEANAQTSKIVTLQAQYQRELEELERQRLEEQRRQEAARAAAAATATAQANATATARAAPTQTVRPGAPTPTPGPAVRVPTPSSGGLPGAIQTDRLQPSAYNMIYPVVRPVVTTEYGERTFAQSFHSGIDLANNNRTPILAAADGKVLEAGLAVPGKPDQSYGMMVIIAHDTKLTTLYAHMDTGNYGPTVKPGDTVKRGQIIGYIGMTGITSGPHLHFEVRENGQHRDPTKYLPK
ncbi:MAG TPA: peptidoglycan DD-metalloendopeptidase family protein [Chloroflexota bacterium]|nr:peptidoglycan DD-metalloendopeptidase family protein [Chloroflexota bacterium]